jgi:glucuronoarabinoxylan endo-1,4-beta-xylanase
MKKHLQDHHSRMIVVSVFITIISLLFTLKTPAQSFVVNGRVSTLTMPPRPVQYASVLFVDNSDTTTVYSGMTDASGNYQIDVIVTSIEPKNNQPINFELEQNYPNPFSSSTAIPYKLNTQSEVEVTIYDILGREVKKFTLGVQPTGVYGVVWDGMNNFGKKVAMGIYFYRIKAGSETQVKKMICGLGERNFIVSQNRILSSPISEIKGTSNVCLPGNDFTVRIANTDSTFPAITTKQIDNIVIQSDTTFDFTVTRAATIYSDSTQQIISGFGAANILPWRPDMTPSEINKAFGTGTGQIGFTILRLRVPYQTNDFSLNVPTAQSAHSMGVLIIASPWSPPPSMKTNNNIVGGRLRDDSYAAYAAHLNSFANYMSNNGVPIYAISVQNEPDVQVSYESCDWNADEMLRFMKENAPDVGTGVFVAESYNFNHTMTDPILNDSVAASNTAFIGGHIYGGGLTRYPLAEAKGKEVWMTEHLELSDDWNGALATGKEINDCMKANMSAYIWWYIVRFYGPILEDGTVSKRGYVMSQYARFIRPGFFRVTATENPQIDVYVTAYKNGPKAIIVAINYSSAAIDQTFKIENGTVTHFTPYVTSETKNCLQEDDLLVANNYFTATLDRSSITTFVSE